MKFKRDRSDVRWYDLAFLGVCIAIALVASGRAEAQQTCPPTGAIASNAALLCWTNATLNTDGSTIPATGVGALTQTRIQRALVLAAAACDFAVVAQTLNVTPNVKMVLFEGLAPGKQCFRVRHVASDANAAEVLSDWSAIISKVAVTPTPPKSRPPTITIY